MPVMAKTKKNLNRRGTQSAISSKQRVFIGEYLNCMNGSQAAERAGYKCPGVIASQMLNGKDYPLVAAEVKKELELRNGKSLKKSDDILRYIHTAMYFEPLKFFQPGDNGGWLISEDQYKNLPPEIGCLIEAIEKRTKIEKEEGFTTETIVFWVKLVSKSEMTKLAAKHQLSQKFEMDARIQTIDWTPLLQGKVKVDVIEEKIQGLGKMIPVEGETK